MPSQLLHPRFRGLLSVYFPYGPHDRQVAHATLYTKGSSKGLCVAFGYKTRWGAWALIAFLVPVTLWMHAFWRLSDPHRVFTEQILFLKNLSTLGSARRC